MIRIIIVVFSVDDAAASVRNKMSFLQAFKVHQEMNNIRDKILTNPLDLNPFERDYHYFEFEDPKIERSKCIKVLECVGKVKLVERLSEC